MNVYLDQIDDVFPPLIAAMVREVAGELALESVEFVPERGYDPSQTPLFHFLGRRDAKIYLGRADAYLSITDMTLDFFLIAPNECWLLESGRDYEGTAGDNALTVSLCVDLTQGDGAATAPGSVQRKGVGKPGGTASHAGTVFIQDLAGRSLRYGGAGVGTDCVCDEEGQRIPRCYCERMELVALGERAPGLVIGSLVRAQVSIPDPAHVVEAVEMILALPPPAFR